MNLTGHEKAGSNIIYSGTAAFNTLRESVGFDDSYHSEFKYKGIKVVLCEFMCPWQMCTMDKNIVKAFKDANKEVSHG